MYNLWERPFYKGGPTTNAHPSTNSGHRLSPRQFRPANADHPDKIWIMLSLEEGGLPLLYVHYLESTVVGCKMEASALFCTSLAQSPPYPSLYLSPPLSLSLYSSLGIVRSDAQHSNYDNHLGSKWIRFIWYQLTCLCPCDRPVLPREG